LRHAHFMGFKRFHGYDHCRDSTYCTVLVILAGPMVSGKSSMSSMDSESWHARPHWTGIWIRLGRDLRNKDWHPFSFVAHHVKLTFHSPVPPGPEERKKNDLHQKRLFGTKADFQMNKLQLARFPFDSPRINRLIDNDVSVFRQLSKTHHATIDGIYDTSIPDDVTKGRAEKNGLSEKSGER